MPEPGWAEASIGLPSLLQPENIMLLEKGAPKPKIKIIDFGLAQKLQEGVAYKSLCGTPQYIGTTFGPRNRQTEKLLGEGGRETASGPGKQGRPCTPENSPGCEGNGSLAAGKGEAPGGVLGSQIWSPTSSPPFLSCPAPEVINYEALSTATDMW